MALTVKDLLNLKQMKKMELIAGEKGLEHIVVTSNIADYEFSPEVKPDNTLVFEADSFVISSLLYAKNDPSLILSSIKELSEYGAAAFAFKDIIYKELPTEAIDFANQHDLPIFKFSTGTYFENIIFEIMDAVQHDDNYYLFEGNIEQMINQTMTSSEIYNISSGLSVIFNKYAACAYIKNLTDKPPLRIEYLHRLFLTAKGLRSKTMIATYNRGIFILMTSQYNQIDKYEIMLGEILDYLSINRNEISISLSDIHPPYDELDKCFRESYFAYQVSRATENDCRYYHEIGLYQLTLPLMDDFRFRSYIDNQLKALNPYPELITTVKAWVKHHGSLTEASTELNCHFNTVRYRLTQVRKLLNCQNASEHELYALLSPLAHQLLTTT